jgi:hypothetical protein
MTDRVNAAMHSMEPTAFQSVVDGARTHPERRDLPARNDAVLALRDRGDPFVDPARPKFAPHDGSNFGLAVHQPMVARKS